MPYRSILIRELSGISSRENGHVPLHARDAGRDLRSRISVALADVGFTDQVLVPDIWRPPASFYHYLLV
jgi:hypothetical protein